MISTNSLGWFNILDEKYTIRQVLGSGSFGKVVLAHNKSIDKTRLDLRTNQNEFVAIKGMTDIFDYITDAKTAYREMHILKRLNHPNIVSLKEILVPKLHSIPINERERSITALRSNCFHELNQGKKDFLRSLGHLYLVFEFVETDLRKIIESDQFMSKAHIRFILYQILCAIKYIHSANVIHRYLTTNTNILILIY